MVGKVLIVWFNHSTQAQQNMGGESINEFTQNFPSKNHYGLKCVYVNVILVHQILG